MKSMMLGRLDSQIAALEGRNAFLEEEVERLLRENANLTSKWVAAADRSYNNNVRAALTACEKTA